MFDTNVTVNKKTTHTTVCSTPEKVEFDIIKENATSFFMEFSRDSEDYRNLLGEKPFISSKEWLKMTEDNRYLFYDRRDQLCGGKYENVETPVKIIRMTYVGSGNILFELIKL